VHSYAKIKKAQGVQLPNKKKNVRETAEERTPVLLPREKSQRQRLPRVVGDASLTTFSVHNN